MIWTNKRRRVMDVTRFALADVGGGPETRPRVAAAQGTRGRRPERAGLREVDQMINRQSEMRSCGAYHA